MPDRSTPQTDMSLFGHLRDCDRRYFEAGAEHLASAPFDTYLMRKFAHQAAGCVSFYYDSAQLYRNALEDYESVLRSNGVANSRIYESTLSEQSRRHLEVHGYVRGDEVMMAHLLGNPAEPEETYSAIWPVLSDADWELKHALHSRAKDFSDGHHYSPADWVNLERAKQDAGYMQCYVLMDANTPVGAVAIAPNGPVFRLKNLYVCPVSRRVGQGALLVRFAIHQAQKLGYVAMGCLANAGSNGEKLYLKQGLKPVGRVVGWSKPLEKTEPKSAKRQQCKAVEA